MTRLMREGEALPEWVDTFGYDPLWTWVYEESGIVKAIGITAPVFGKLFLFRLQAREALNKWWMFSFFRQIAKDSLARGISHFYLLCEPSERVSKVFIRKGVIHLGQPSLAFGSWRTWT